MKFFRGPLAMVIASGSRSPTCEMLDARPYHPPQSLLTLSAFQDSPLWSHSAREEPVLVAKCTVLLHLPVVNVVHDDSGYAVTP